MDSKKIQFNLNYNYLSSSIYSKPNEIKSIKVETVTLNQIQQTYNTRFNTLVMDIEGQEFSVITNNNLSNFNKVIMEIHPKILSKDELEIISKKLILERFILIEKKGNVEFWKK